jgi:hypothetical protein
VREGWRLGEEEKCGGWGEDGRNWGAKKRKRVEVGQRGAGLGIQNGRSANFGVEKSAKPEGLVSMTGDQPGQFEGREWETSKPGAGSMEESK